MKKNKLTILAAITVLGLSVLSGCGAGDKDPGEPPTEVVKRRKTGQIQGQETVIQKVRTRKIILYSLRAAVWLRQKKGINMRVIFLQMLFLSASAGTVLLNGMWICTTMTRH